MSRSGAVVTISALLIWSSAIADDQEGHQCARDPQGQICPPPNGYMMRFHGVFLCGRGECVVTHGELMCSTQTGGRVGIQAGQPICSGGCEPAKAEYCERLR